MGSEMCIRDSPYVAGCQKLGQGVAEWMVPTTRFRSWFVRQNYRILPYLPWKGMLAASARRTASAIELKPYA